MQDKWRQSLLELVPLEKSGRILGVEIVKPRPWYGSEFILMFHRRGQTIQEVARNTGFSVATVENTLRTGGEHPNTGPSCDKHNGRVLCIDEALKLNILPCTANCICSYRSISSSERRLVTK